MTESSLDEWVAFTHEESGRRYYCNEAYKGGEAVWVLPEGVKKYIDTEKGDEVVWVGQVDERGGAAVEEAANFGDNNGDNNGNDNGDDGNNKGVSGDAMSASTNATTNAITNTDVVEGASNPQDVIKEVERFFNQKDAILEPACLSKLVKYQAAMGGTIPPSAVSSLVSSYTSIPNECGMICSWLRELEGHTPAHEQVVREVYEETVKECIEEGFRAEKADEVLKMDKKDVGFLDGILGEKCWRRMLINLQGDHKDSALLTYCLKQISKRGHHDELAGQTDYFSVFNGMLISEIKTFLKSDFELVEEEGRTETAFDKALIKLVKICLSAPHVFVYSQAVVSSLLESPSLGEAGRKRLNMLLQRLHAAVVMGDVDCGGDGGGGEARKRAAEIGLFLAENTNGKKVRREGVEKVMRRKGKGMKVDQLGMERLVKSVEEEGEEEINVVKEYPGFVLVLLESIFSPLARSRENGVREVAAKLLAMVAGREGKVKELLLKCGDSCEGLEGVLSFSLGGAAGNEVERLEGLGDEEVVYRGIVGSDMVSLGVLVWARVFSDSGDFVNSTSYPTTTPGLLSVARLAAQKWDSCHMASFDLVVGIFRQDPTNVTEKQVRAIKEQCLRLFLFLLSRGHVIPVANFIAGEVNREGGKMEESLIRYFFEGLISLVGGKGLGEEKGGEALKRVIALSRVEDALNKGTFGKEKRERLSLVLAGKVIVSQNGRLSTLTSAAK